MSQPHRFPTDPEEVFEYFELAESFKNTVSAAWLTFLEFVERSERMFIYPVALSFSVIVSMRYPTHLPKGVAIIFAGENLRFQGAMGMVWIVLCITTIVGCVLCGYLENVTGADTDRVNVRYAVGKLVTVSVPFLVVCAFVSSTYGLIPIPFACLLLVLAVQVMPFTYGIMYAARMGDAKG